MPRRIARELRPEVADIDARLQRRAPVRFESESLQRGQVPVGTREHAGKATIEEPHEPLGADRHRVVVEETVNVCGKVSVIDTGDWYLHHLRGDQADQPNRARRGDVHDIRLQLFDEAQNLRQRRESNLQLVVPWHLRGECRLEVHDVVTLGNGQAGGRDDGEIAPEPIGTRGHVLDEPGDAVDVAKRVGDETGPHGSVEDRLPVAAKRKGMFDPLQHVTLLVRMEEREDVRDLSSVHDGVADQMIDDAATVAIAQCVHGAGGHGLAECAGEIVGEVRHSFVL